MQAGQVEGVGAYRHSVWVVHHETEVSNLMKLGVFVFQTPSTFHLPPPWVGTS
jgi:hypothetical protein